MRSFQAICLKMVLFTLAVFLPQVSAAQLALVFERATISIALAPPKSDDKTAVAKVEPITYSIELRSEQALKLESIMALSTLESSTGVMILFDTPTVIALPAWKNYDPVDALFVLEDGSIIQILPNVVLNELTQTITSKTSIKAFLFLKAGQVAARGIRPRDVVQGNMFASSPPIQE